MNANLFLIKPLGFDLNNSNLRRAALDYFDLCDVRICKNLSECISYIDNSNIYLTDTSAEKYYSDCDFTINDTFIFGPESKGLDTKILNAHNPNNIIKIPMAPSIRSLNICNSVSIVAYECWRQSNFIGS